MGNKISRLRETFSTFGLFPIIASIAVFLLYIFLTWQGVRFAGSPTATPLPTQSSFLTPTTADDKVYCKKSKSRICTMECLFPPPYLCGSNGKSYCTACQACIDSEVDWYQFQVNPCPQKDTGPKPLGDAASKEECLTKGGKWQPAIVNGQPGPAVCVD